MKTSGAVLRIKVQKKNPAGEVTYEYEGELLSRDENSVKLEAWFDRADMQIVDVVFKTGDRFVEYYFADRWYNILVVHDRATEKIKGWYCNVSQPAIIKNDLVSYVDLALDLWVSADGRQTILDQDEFEALNLNEELRTGALKGLSELKQLFLKSKPPG